MTPTRARAPIGERPVGRVPRCRGTVPTVLGAIALSGITGLTTVEGATTGAVFSAFVTSVLASTLGKGDVVVLDNLAAHRVQAARDAIETAGARMLIQPLRTRAQSDRERLVEDEERHSEARAAFNRGAGQSGRGCGRQSYPRRRFWLAFALRGHAITLSLLCHFPRAAGARADLTVVARTTRVAT